MEESTVEMSASFFDANNAQAARMRENFAKIALQEAFDWFKHKGGT